MMGMGMGSRHAPSDAAAAFRFAQVLTPFWQAQITMDKRAFLHACTATTLAAAVPRPALWPNLTLPVLIWVPPL